MILPKSKADLLRKVIMVKDACRASASSRAALSRAQSLLIDTGRPNGSRSIMNTLNAHIDRSASHLFSPVDLRFVLDFESHYDRSVLAQGEITARVLTREWERKDIDVMFAEGVDISLRYGAAILKQMWGNAGLEAKLVMPWQFGVYREDMNNLDDQEAVCESGLMTLEEVWRRISHLPDAESMYRRIKSHSNRESADTVDNSFFHNVLSTSILNTDLETQRQQPGGVVQLSGDVPNGVVPPELMIDLVQFHELYIKDDDRQDYTTVLLIEPDIIVSPYFKRENFFAPETQPFSLIQANRVPGLTWGKSEIIDLAEPQALLSTLYDDAKRMMGLQVDKLLAFSGGEGINDEKYAEFRTAGFVDLGAGGSVTDLTPQMPGQMFQFIELIHKSMEEVAGFNNIMSGQGEAGVRAGVHAETLTRMASPRMRDRALLLERQCAAAADKTLSLLQQKDGKMYSTDPTTGPVSQFLLYDLPEDRRVTVDSHSTSPIFAEDHKDLIGFGLKAGFLGGDSAIELLPFPQKDLLKQRYKQMQDAKAKLIQEHPEILTKGHGKK